ncbi:PhzF family phenazine biosynthesis protein [Oscillatoria sp. FACHB-1406]|uniref:PhzF family phenazine biosynthesis protein n=1 Tax=Oscillatoria sp. FACHB-1406 TaxID=2692846 RepID=UPI001689555C|nr:PhzF family phenazine biosynthesis protein [Oscillatoria sp. FACHB-1406]MBD2580047.1 PhzF family phenazine biosynthesis protein [Oscillatoria sp. FACHB-1406]
MVSFPFYIVDVFSPHKYAGNQLAVIADSEQLSDAEMLAIAREMNYSETTFIRDRTPRNGGYEVRIFTPKKELPFAGHPTLGTAYILMTEILTHPSDTLLLNLKVGQIPVRRSDSDLLWMRQNPPTFGQNFEARDLAEVLTLEADSIDSRFPIQAVSTGVPFIIVPLTSHEALKKIRVNREQYFQWVEGAEAKEILVFCPETYAPENNLSVRVFAESLGIPEDPATGSANGCLAGYLVEHLYFKRSAIEVRVEQGYEIDRPSLLFLKAERKDTEIEVSVGGNVVMVAKGQLV